MLDTTALGAAFAAGFAVGIWNMNTVESNYDTFVQTLPRKGKSFVNLKCTQLE